MIQESAALAADGDLKYQEILLDIEKRHLSCIKKLIPIKTQSEALSQIKQQINALGTLHEGVYLLKELSATTKDHMLGFGELLSYFIIAKAAEVKKLDVGLKNARDLIFTSEDMGKNMIDYPKTFESIRSYFKTIGHRITIVPGFVASDLNGVPTTLGRGGSDLTAALFARHHLIWMTSCSQMDRLTRGGGVLNEPTKLS